MVDLDESRFGKRVAFGAYADQRLALVHRRAGIPADVVPAIFLPGDGKLVLADTHCRRHANFSPGWILTILGRNYLLVLVSYRLWSSRLYLQKAQGRFTKYNPQFSEGKSDSFLCNNQLLDNLTFTLGSGVPIMNAYEVLGRWSTSPRSGV